VEIGGRHFTTPTADRRCLVPDARLFDSQCHYSPPPPPLPIPQHSRPSDMLTTSSHGGIGVASTKSSEVSEWSYLMEIMPYTCIRMVFGLNFDLVTHNLDRHFSCFPQSLQANTWILLPLRHDRFLPHPFQSITHRII
jgi:hypothetical protein